LTAPPDLTLDQILERLGLGGTPRPEQRRAVGALAYGGRLPLAWLTVLRRADFLPYDSTKPDDQ
jgi:hypothetical protein